MRFSRITNYQLFVFFVSFFDNLFPHDWRLKYCYNENWTVVAEEETWIWEMIEKDREAVVVEVAVAALAKIRLMHLVDYCKH